MRAMTKRALMLFIVGSVTAAALSGCNTVEKPPAVEHGFEETQLVVGTQERAGGETARFYLVEIPGGGQGTGNGGQEAAGQSLPEFVGPDEFPPGYNPLTGLPAADPTLLTMRPVFISISHFPPMATRPLTGISFAPWVFELFIGEGQTRLFTLFYGQYPEAVGVTGTDGGAQSGAEVSGGASAGEGANADLRIQGVRSGRVAYEDFRQFFNACMIIGGADPQVAAKLNICANAFSNDPDNIGAGGLDISRLYHIALQSAQGRETPNLSGNRFSLTVPEGGKPANELLMWYNYLNQTNWFYDAAKRAYMRYEDFADGSGEYTQSIDRLTGEPLGSQNVIVMFVNHRQMNAAGTIFEMDVAYSRGQALLFRDGQMFPILWDTTNGEYEKETGRLRPIRFTDQNGNPIALHPGNSWVHVVTNISGYQELADGAWKVRFYAPSYP